MRDEFVGAKSAMMGTADSKWNSCGNRSATVFPQLPEGLSLIRRYSGNSGTQWRRHQQHLLSSVGAPCGDRRRCAMGSSYLINKYHLRIEIDLFWNMLSFSTAEFMTQVKKE